MESELWKPIVGFEDHYKVSNMGHVFSLWKNRLLVPHVNVKNGYAYVSLRGAKNFYAPLHRLVAKHFVPGYKEGFCINHKNEIKTDNRAENLEWCSKRYNNAFNRKAMRCSVPILQMTKDGHPIHFWESARDAAKATGGSFKNISACCRGLRKSCAGFSWRYAL